MIQFWVSGEPKPKGSKQPFVVNGHAVMTESKTSKDWERTIRNYVAGLNVPMIRGPVVLSATFYLPIPKAHLPKPKSADIWKRKPVPQVKPDLDKLVRSLKDALSKVLYEDDAKVIDIKASKRYTNSRPGVDVMLEEADPGEIKWLS